MTFLQYVDNMEQVDVIAPVVISLLGINTPPPVPCSRSIVSTIFGGGEIMLLSFWFHCL